MSAKGTPPVSSNGKVLFVGSVFSNMQYGSYEVMRRMLHQFDPSSFDIVSAAYRSNADYDFASQTITVGIGKLPSGKLGLLVSLLQIPAMAYMAFWRLRKKKHVAVVAVHPSLDMLLLSLILARMLKLPLFPYLHDTIAEAQEKSRIAGLARWTQRKVFSAARCIFVMSEAMREYYANAYGLKCIALPHIYAEAVVRHEVLPASHFKTIFWSGGIYGINDKAVRTVVRIATEMGIATRITAAGGVARDRILDWQRQGMLVEPVYYPERADYLAALQHQGVHLLALNSSSESEFGKGELSTIFPTKTPDYLASGRPTLVYCPSDFGLARYFTKYQCGIVVSTENELRTALQHVFSDSSDVTEIVRNAQQRMADFKAENVAQTLSATIDNSTAD